MFNPTSSEDLSGKQLNSNRDVPKNNPNCLYPHFDAQYTVTSQSHKEKKSTVSMKNKYSFGAEERDVNYLTKEMSRLRSRKSRHLF